MTSAGSGCPQCRQAISARALGAGRPQCEQKCEPTRRGAPQRHLEVLANPPGAAVAAKRSESSSCMRCSIWRTSPARSIRSSGRKRSRRTISTVRPPTSRISISRRRTSERRCPRIRRGCGIGLGEGDPSATSSSTTTSLPSGGAVGTPSGGGCARRLRAQGMCGESNGRSRTHSCFKAGRRRGAPRSSRARRSAVLPACCRRLWCRRRASGRRGRLALRSRSRRRTRAPSQLASPCSSSP